jgi:hypothetical protein
MSGQAVTDLPITTGTERLGDIRDNYLAGRMPDENITEPYVSTIASNGVTPSGGVMNPYFRPASLANMQYMMNGGLMGNKGAVTTSSGTTYMRPTPPPQAIQPTVGSNYQQQPSVQIPSEAQQDTDDAKHDAVQATIASQIADLKAQQKHIKYLHTHSRQSIMEPQTTPPPIRTIGGYGRNIRTY